MELFRNIKLNVFNSLIEIIKKKFIQVYFYLLFGLLLFIYSPSFFHPPRSDYWPALYFFYRIDMLAGSHKWKYILAHDPLINVTFRPLSFFIPYFEHFIFGSNYIYIQLVNFSLYFISILLLYKLATYFCKNKMLIAIFLGIFACLFSHFDIVCWSFQSHIILSFCLFLLGFISYINYIKSGRKIILFFVAIIFLSGMLLYETFLFWPLSIIILIYIDSIFTGDSPRRGKLLVSYLWTVGIIYIFYGLFFFLDRGIKAQRGSGISLGSLFSLPAIISNSFSAVFNILYNNFLVNLVPRIAYPLKIDENLNMGGFIEKYSFIAEKIIFFSGGLAICAFFCMIIYLFRKKLFEIIKVLMFFSILLFSELFLLFHCKSLVNSNVYNLTQFRFQYIPNALFILIVLFLIDKFLKLSKVKSTIIGAGVILILILNIQASREGISILSAQLTPLKKMLSSIKVGIKTGQISKENRLYLDGNIAKRLPLLCWNKEMGERCMRGTYQWIFSKKEIGYFSPLEDAKWVINEKDFSIVGK